MTGFSTQGNAQAQIFGVAPNQQYLYPPSVPTSPLGSIAGFKGDFLSPVFNTGFFIVGVVIVVKVMLSLMALLKAKLVGIKGLPHWDGSLDRKRRSSDGKPLDYELLNGLTHAVIEALDSEECSQRLMCELGETVNHYEEFNVIKGMVERWIPKQYDAEVKAFNLGQNCSSYKCGFTS